MRSIGGFALVWQVLGNRNDQERANENEREGEHPCAIRAHTPI